jgi:alkylation response protein AidB-like acyl-CoA dehydrogenase
MIDFSLSEEERAVRDTIHQFIRQDVMPLEPEVLRRERHGLPPLEDGQLKELQQKAKQGGWWGILYAGTDEQKQQYLIPTIDGERRSCFAITEPGAGSDARNLLKGHVKLGQLGD